MTKNRIPSTIDNYKFVLFGSAEVGKSSLVRRLIHNEFCINYVPTVEDSYKYLIQSHNRLCNLTIFDTSGTHQFPAMKDLCIKNCAAFILVLSVDDGKSLQQFMKDSETVLEQRGDAKILTVVNKIDKEDRAFSTIQVIRHMEKKREKYPRYQYKYLETSAKNNTNVHQLFYEAIELLSPGFQHGKEKKKDVRGISQSCTIL